MFIQEYQEEGNKWKGTELDEGAQGYMGRPRSMWRVRERDTEKVRESIKRQIETRENR